MPCAIKEAAARGDVEAVMVWVGTDDDVRLEAVHGTWSDRTRVTRSLLMIAAEKGRFMLTKALLRRGAKPNWQSCDGHSALTLAVTGTCDRREQGRSKVVRALLVGGADANHRIGGARGCGDTALMIAACHGRKHLVGTLLFHGAAQVDQQDSEGWTALMGAAHSGCPDVVERARTRAYAAVAARPRSHWLDGGLRGATSLIPRGFVLRHVTAVLPRKRFARTLAPALSAGAGHSTRPVAVPHCRR